MTATLELTQSGGGRNWIKPSEMGPGVFQVNLLPPEVRSARTLTRVKRWLAVVVLLCLLLVVGLVALAVLAQRAALEELAKEQQATADLAAEQLEYAEVPLVLRQLDRIVTARETGMSTEVLWRPYLSAIAATAPAGVAVETIGLTGATPMALAPAPADALAAPSVATVTFSARSLTLPDTAQWIDGLGSIPGFADPWFSAVSLSEEEGVVYYSVNATVQVDEQAYAGRFTPTEAED